MRMRALNRELGRESTIVDFEENMLVLSVRRRTKIWEEKGNLVGFAYVDDYHNLQFALEPRLHTTSIANEMIAWGIRCMRKLSHETGQSLTLDASFRPEHTWQIALIKRHGFQEETMRSLCFERDLSVPLRKHPIPPGFHLRTAQGEGEVNDLVELHQAAFGTKNMTVEGRLAIMRSPDYEPDLDFVLVSPGGQLAAFCICGFNDKTNGIGYTDPIGTHAKYQRQGLGKAVLTYAMQALREKGATIVSLGTSSENIAMVRLAISMGFAVVSENLWFSKQI